MITCRFIDKSRSPNWSPWRWEFEIACNHESEWHEIWLWCRDHGEHGEYYPVRMLMRIYARTADAAFAFRMRWC